MYSNREIVDMYLNNRLLLTCCECQFAKLKNKNNLEDFFQDLVLYLLSYDNEKLNNAHLNNHFNALVTRMVQNNIFSVTSPYYKNYRKFESKTEEISNKIRETVIDE